MRLYRVLFTEVGDIWKMDRLTCALEQLDLCDWEERVRMHEFVVGETGIDIDAD